MAWLLVVIGLALLVAGADLLVRGAARLAGNLGVPALVIGLTVVAFGTSAPELAVSVRSAWAGQSELAIANVVGSNVFNVLCVLGLSGLVSPEPLLAGIQMVTLDLPVMLGVAILCLPLFFAGGTLNRFEGVLFLALYIAYVWYLVALQLGLGYLARLEGLILYGLVPATLMYVVLCLAGDLLMRRKSGN